MSTQTNVGLSVDNKYNPRPNPETPHLSADDSRRNRVTIYQYLRGAKNRGVGFADRQSGARASGDSMKLFRWRRKVV